MLEGLAALGLAANILQLIGVAADLVSETRDFLQSTGDALPAHEKLKTLTIQGKQLSQEVTRVASTQKPLASYENAAQLAATHCSTDAVALLNLLDKLKVQRHSNVFVTSVRFMKQSIRNAKAANTIEDQLAILQAREAQLRTALLNLILHNNDINFNELKSLVRSKDIRDGKRLLLFQEELKQMIDDQTRLVSNELRGLDCRLGNLELEAKARLILDSLHFADMDYRRQIISDAHRKTFEWCYERNASPFLNWLENEDCIFWICGLAGSGKSTLMKFLSSEPRTHDALAKNIPAKGTVVVVQHYFWYDGTPLQKTHEGLLQSIFAQILSSDKSLDLMPYLCGDRLKKDRGALTAPWTRAELVNAIQRIRQFPRIRVCAFVDGLDEYFPQSEQGKLIADLKLLSEVSNFKLCVSSRPWTAFCDAFGKLTQIHVERLTRDDIGKYTRDRLQAKASAANFALIVSDEEDLVDLVTEKAKGVFLWVSLVVAALEEQVEAHSSRMDLLKCVENFPAKLEDFFRTTIYARIHESWHSRTAQALKTAMSISRSLDSPSKRGNLGYSDRLPGYTNSFLPFWLLREKIDTPASVISMDVMYATPAKINDMIIATERYLNACCKDFLYVLPHTQSPRHHSKERPPNQIRSSRVSFLHRTVHDFLCTGEMSQLLDSNVSDFFKDEDFLFNLAVACSKVIIDAKEYDAKKDLCLDFVDTTLTTLPIRAPSCYERNYVSYTTAMGEIDRVGAQYVETSCIGGKCWPNTNRDTQKGCVSLIHRLVACHMHSYTKMIMTKGPTDWMIDCGSPPPLLSALGLLTACPFSLSEIDRNFIAFLLENGQSPDMFSRRGDGCQCSREECNTVWACFLRKWIWDVQDTQKGESTTDQQMVWYVMLTLLVRKFDIKDRRCLKREICAGSSGAHWPASDILEKCAPTQHLQDLRKISHSAGSTRVRAINNSLAGLLVQY